MYVRQHGGHSRQRLPRLRRYRNRHGYNRIEARIQQGQVAGTFAAVLQILE